MSRSELHQVTVWIPKKQWDIAVEMTDGAPTNWLRQELLAGLIERLNPIPAEAEQSTLFEVEPPHPQQPRPEKGILWSLQRATDCSRCRRHLQVGVIAVLYTDPTRRKPDPAGIKPEGIPTRQVDCLDCRILLGYHYW